MATYNTKQDLLNEALGTYAGLGFRLLEPDDHILELSHLGKTLASFNQATATITVIRDSCQNYLDNAVTKEKYS